MRLPTGRATLATLIITCAILAQPLHAQNTVTMGVGQGTAGESGIEVIVTATHDQPLHGYQLSFTFPSDVLTLTRVTTAGTDVQELDPDFEVPLVNNSLGLAGMGVILTLSDSPASIVELPATSPAGTEQIIARLTFAVRSSAPGGVYPLRLVDGIGSPLQFNRFTTGGLTTSPTLMDGEFIVTGAGNVVQLEKRFASSAVNDFDIFAFAQHPQPIDGFQVSFTYDNTSVKLGTATIQGTHMQFEVGNCGQAGEVEFCNFKLIEDFEPGRDRHETAILFDASAPFSRDGSQQLSANPGDPMNQTLVRYEFDISRDLQMDPTWVDLVLDDLAIAGETLATQFIGSSGGVVPTFVHGKIYFETGDLTGRIVDSNTGEGVPNVTVVTNPDGISVLTDGSGAYTLSDVPPGEYSLRFTSTSHYSGRVPSILASGPSTLVPDVALFRIPPPPMKAFLRGFVNNDDKIDLSDPISLLSYLFSGGRTPHCLASADANDDHSVNLADAVTLLNFLFASAGPLPPPFSLEPTDCGLDPTPSGFSCEESTCDT